MARPNNKIPRIFPTLPRGKLVSVSMDTTSTWDLTIACISRQSYAIMAARLRPNRQ
jgi:hypothetical protein